MAVSADYQVERALPGEQALHLPEMSRRFLSLQRMLLALSLVLTDAAALALAFRLAYWIRFELQLTVAPHVPGVAEDYLALATVLIPLWLLVLAVFNLYNRHARPAGIAESASVFNACTTATMMVIVGTFVFPEFVIARAWLVSLWMLSFLFVAANRFIARRAVYRCRRRGYLVTPAAIVGTNEEAVSLAMFLSEWDASGIWMTGFVSTDASGPGSGSLPAPVLGSIRDIRTIVKTNGIEDLIVAITAASREELLDLCENVDSLPVRLRMSSGVYELLTTRVSVQTLGTVPLMTVHKNRLDRAEVLIKTLLEMSLSVLALMVLSPVLLAAAVAIKIDSRGPLMYRRRVLGASGTEFDAFKFRTMHMNGEALLERRPEAAAKLRTLHKLKDDPRVTRVGRWLRKYSLDELPQLVNVLRGEMSLVGPRMITAAEVEKYGRQRLNLLAVKPGITGLWQVSGRSDLSYEERVRIDMYYVRNYSVWLDLQILFIETLPAVLRGRGAY
jgi:exopolysaccharide biosynthesis polyprenyl glycosylphosphotransferase